MTVIGNIRTNNTSIQIDTSHPSHHVSSPNSPLTPISSHSRTRSFNNPAESPQSSQMSSIPSSDIPSPYKPHKMRHSNSGTKYIDSGSSMGGASSSTSHTVDGLPGTGNTRSSSLHNMGSGFAQGTSIPNTPTSLHMSAAEGVNHASSADEEPHPEHSNKALVRIKKSKVAQTLMDFREKLDHFFRKVAQYVLGVSPLWSKDTRVRVLLLIFVDLYVCLISVPYVFVHIFFGNYWPSVPVATAFPVLALNMLVFRLVKSDQLMAIVFFLEMYVAIYGVAWVMGGYQHSGAAISWLTIGNLCIFVFEMKFKVIWLTMYWVCAIASFVADMIIMSQPQGPAKVRESIFFGYANVTLSGLVMVLAFTIFRWSTIKQVRLAQSVTKSVAFLRLSSPLLDKLCATDEKDLYDLEKYLKQIVINVREYVPYLPSHLVDIAESSTEDGEEEQEKEEIITVRDQSVADAKSIISGQPIDSDATSSIASSNKIKIKNPRKRTAQRKGFTPGDPRMPPMITSKRIKEGLSKRDIVHLVTDIAGFHRLCNFNDVPIVEELFAQYIDLIEQSVHNNSGVVHFFSGDKVTCSFNAAKRCINPELRAVCTAVEIKKKWNSILKKHDLHDHSVHIAITKGNGAYCGNIGSNTLKRWVNVSKSLTQAYQFLQVAKSNSCQVIISDEIAGAVNIQIRIRFLDVVKERDSPHRHILFEAIDEKKIAADEWMYEVLQSDQTDLEKSLRNAWIFFLKGQTTDAFETLEQVPPQMQKDPNYNRLRKLLEQNVDGTMFSAGETI